MRETEGESERWGGGREGERERGRERERERERDGCRQTGRQRHIE